MDLVVLDKDSNNFQAIAEWMAPTIRSTHLEVMAQLEQLKTP